MTIRKLYPLILILLSSFFSIVESVADDAAATVVRDAIDYWRGSTSTADATMTVHRPDWERTMSLQLWTKGSRKSLVRFTAPVKDSGNASLIVDDIMWSYSPKVNRVIKIPSSMRTQSWMGSDFSYNDLSKADDIVRRYHHKIIKIDKHEGKNVTVVESIPKEDAPVVWGKEILFIREDRIIIRHEFYDQEMKLVKYITATDIDVVGGKIYAKTIVMTDAEEENKWTRVIHDNAHFGQKINDNIFTVSNLRNPRAEK